MSKFQQLGLVPDDLVNVPVLFGNWLPDLLTVNNPGAVEALNVLPSENGYVPYKPILTSPGLTLPDTCRGAVSVFASDASSKLYAGTTSGLFARSGAAFNNLYAIVTALSTNYLWQFIPFGTYVVAIHPQVSPVFSNIDTLGNFVIVGGTPPKAACGARVGNFVVLGNLTEIDGSIHPSRIRWGGFNRIDAPWVSDPATQADFQDMPSEGGPVVGISGREFGTVFQTKSISRMTYIGLPTVFKIETVEEERGALCVGGIVDVGTAIFYLANDGFFVWNGVNSTPIADNKVNRYFFSRLNYAARGRVVGSWDAENQCIRWAFPVGSSTDLTEVMIFSYKENNWTHAFDNLEYLVSQSLVVPTTVDPTAVSRPALSGFNNAHSYGPFSGPSLEAIIDTAEASAPGGSRIYVACVRPLVDVAAPVAKVKIAKREQFMGENLIYGDAIAQEDNGECAVMTDGRYMRFRMILPAAAAWQHAAGMEVWRKPTGRF